MEGLVHSIESFGTVDGPGIRLVVFLKGCPLRCLYCHNPDTWTQDGAIKMDSEKILAMYEKNKEFYINGGITITGGEPLLQIDFLIDILSKAKQKNIHTCIDTSGILFNELPKEKFDELIKYVDLVLLDIKQINNEKHFELTGKSNSNVLEFALYLNENKIPMSIRHVVVDGYTNNPEDLIKLGKFIGKLEYVKSLDVLPFHNLGKIKYEKLGIPYKLMDMESLSKETAIKAKTFILKGIKEIRNRYD